MRSFFKSLIPPIVARLYNNKTTHTHSQRSYRTYAEALKDCPKEGYEAAEIVTVVVEKNRIFRRLIEDKPTFDLNAIRTLVGIGLAKSHGMMRVIDFGGGGGYHYTIAQAALGNDVDLRWNVVETTAMTAAAQKNSSAKLRFFDNIEDAREDLGETDFVFTSGTLHCCPDPLENLKELLKVNAKYVFITRTSFNDLDGQIANVQRSMLSDNGPGPLPAAFKNRPVYYPNVFVSKKTVEQLLSHNYEIRFATVEDKDAYEVGGKKIHMYGYFCVRKA